MTHPALKRRPRWLQPHNLRALRRPLPWLIALALALLVGGVGLIARFALYLASPSIVRYANELVASGGADYTFWALGPLIPPINPDVIEAAAAEPTPGPPPGPNDPQDSVPIAVVGVPTAAPPSPTAAPPSPTPSSTVAPAAAPASTSTASARPSQAATATAAPARAPSIAPTSTARPSSTPVAATSTPVTRPDTPLPPAPTSTRAPTQPPNATATPPIIPTTPPVQPPRNTPVPTATRMPSPTPAPEDPPLARFAASSRIEAEPAAGLERTVSIELVLSKSFTRPVSVPFTVEGASATPGEDFEAADGTATFAPGESSATISLTILGDTTDEPNERLVIRLGSPTNATLGSPSELTVTITDETAPPTVSFAASTRTVGEGVGSVAATVQLSEPGGFDVTVPYVVQGSAAASDHSLRAGTLVIPAGSSSARLRFGIVDDKIDEQNETVGIYLGTPTNAQLGPPSIYTVTIIDDDTAGVRITPVSLSLTEGAASTYTVTLTSQPVAPVTVTVTTPDGEVSASPATLTFTAANWNTPRTVTVTADDDAIDEDGDNDASTHMGVVQHSVTSADRNYGGIAADDVTVTITDNDTAGVSVSPISLIVAEDGITDTYDVVLESQPVANVTITITTPDGEVSASPTRLTFTPGNWNRVQTVTVEAEDDEIDEDGDNDASTHTGVVTHAVASADPNYSGIAAAPVTATITDNDTAGVAISPQSLAVTEGATGANYTVRLTSRPTAAVTITLTPDDQVTASVATLTFTPGTWNIAQSVTVTAVNDAIDEDGDGNATTHTGVIRHSVASADPFFDDATNRFVVDDVTATITDNDTAGFLVTPLNLTVNEGGPAGSYSVRLTSEPLANVTIAVGAGPAGVAAVGPATLTFTPGTWNITQTVTVSPVDNDIDAPNATFSSTHTAASADALYDARPIPPVAVTIADDDTAGVLIAPTALTLAEGGVAATYAITLMSEPVAPVTITLTTPDGQVTVSPTSLTFTPGNWNTAQSVTVTAVDDAVDEDGDGNTSTHTGVVEHTVTSADPNYEAFPAADVTASIADNDTVQVLLSTTSLSVAEGGPATTYTVALATRPTRQVQIVITPTAQLDVSPTNLVFTPGNWATAQTVTVAAVDDFIDEADPHTVALVHNVSSLDPFYNIATAGPVDVAIADDDTAAITVSPTALATGEGGVVSYTVRLESQPTANITLTLGVTPTGRVSLSAASLSFTPLTWSTPQTVTVTALDNSVDAPDATVTISHAVAGGDPLYAALPADPVTLTIADDDTAALLLAPASVAVSELLTATDHSASYGARLGSQPTAPVSVTLSFDASQISVAPAPLVFTAANWAITQTVTVTAVDDLVLEGPQAAAIGHTLSGADAVYAALPGATVTVAIADDDQAGVDFAPAALSLSESITGTNPISGAVVLALRSQPTAPVTITLAPDAQILAAPTALVFTPLSWSTPQTVTVTAVDDLIDETAAHTGSLSLSLASADPFYDSRLVPPYSVTIEDDDTAAVIVSAATGQTTSEAGASVTFTIRLGSEPLTPVSISALIDKPGEAAVTSPAMPIEFTAANWSTPVTVTVTGRDDLDYDGFVPYAVSFGAAGDASYAAIPAAAIPSVALTNADDEPALASVGDPAAALREGDGGLRALRFPVSLRRASPVSVTVSYETYDLSATGGRDYLPASGTRVIPPGATSAYIDVYLIGDRDYEDDEQFAVRLTGAAAPGDLTAVGEARGVGRIRDDDEPTVRFAAADLVVREDAGPTSVLVRLDAPLTTTVSVQYTTIDGGQLAGTAAVGEDYLGGSGTLTFAPGETSKAIVLTILDGDTIADATYETVRLSLFNGLGAPIGEPGVASVTIVEDGAASPLASPPFLSTAGPDASATDGYWYTAAGSGADFLQMIVPCGWPAGQPLTIELWSPAIHSGAGSFDGALGPVPAPPPGPTAFELFGPGIAAGLGGLTPAAGGAGSLSARTFAPTGDPEAWTTFHTLADPTPCGRYLLRSSASGSDENQWAVRAAGGAAVRFARLLSTVEQNSPVGTQACTTSWLAVPPGAAQLRLRSFDLDAGAVGLDPTATITYYGPDEPFDPEGRMGGIAGAASGESVWGEDLIAWPAAGWWRAVTCTSGRNRFIVEAAADGALLALHAEPPPASPDLTVTLTAAPAAAAEGEPISVSASYTAAGVAAAHQLVLTVELPPELAFAGDPCAGAALACSSTADSLTLTAAGLAPGQSGSHSFVATARAGAAGQLAAPRLTASLRDELGHAIVTRAGALVAIE